MEKDDVLKIKAAVLYIIKKNGCIDFMHLFKILYFAERHQYAEYGQHLIKDSFCALEKGPVPSFLYDATKAVTGRNYATHQHLNLISDCLESAGGELDYVLKAKCEPDMDYLSEAEIEAIDMSYNENIDKNIDTLSSSSHDEAWKEAWDKGHNSLMDSITIAKAGGASEGFLEYLRENELLEKAIAG